jgi:plastocyanin
MRAVAVLPAGFLLVAVVFLAGCGGSSSKTSSSGGKQTIAGVSANDHGTKQAASSGSTQIELDNYYFAPTVLKGKPGQKVTLQLKNTSGTEHNFSIDAQHVSEDLQPGKQATVTVTIPKSGQISFYCKYHKALGMAVALEASG